MRLRDREQLQIIGSEHDAVILRADRVVAARRQREAEPFVSVSRAVQVVHEDDHVVDPANVAAHALFSQTLGLGEAPE
jgi:hypothetical protein